jgi:hypothetical protein
MLPNPASPTQISTSYATSYANRSWDYSTNQINSNNTTNYYAGGQQQQSWVNDLTRFGSFGQYYAWTKRTVS